MTRTVLQDSGAGLLGAGLQMWKGLDWSTIGRRGETFVRKECLRTGHIAWVGGQLELELGVVRGKMINCIGVNMREKDLESMSGAQEDRARLIDFSSFFPRDEAGFVLRIPQELGDVFGLLLVVLCRRRLPEQAFLPKHQIWHQNTRLGWDILRSNFDR